MSVGLLSSYVGDHDAITGISVHFANSSTAVTSAGLFTAAMNKRVITATGTGGVATGTVFTYTDASNGVLSAAFTGTTNNYTSAFKERRVALTQQQLQNPVLAKLVDPSSNETFLLPTFTTPASGLVRVLISLPIFGSSTNADNFLKLGLVHADDSVLLPKLVNDVAHSGRRVNLQNSMTHRPRLDLQYTLPASTTYSDLYIGLANGNQTDGAGSASYTVMWGGGKGMALAMVWSLD